MESILNCEGAQVPGTPSRTSSQFGPVKKERVVGRIVPFQKPGPNSRFSLRSVSTTTENVSLFCSATFLEFNSCIMKANSQQSAIRLKSALDLLFAYKSVLVMQEKEECHQQAEFAFKKFEVIWSA